jgi:hypothetical protein
LLNLLLLNNLTLFVPLLPFLFDLLASIVRLLLGLFLGFLLVLLVFAATLRARVSNQ